MNIIDKMIEMKNKRGWDWLDVIIVVLVLVSVVLILLSGSKCLCSIDIKSTEKQTSK